MKYLLSGFIFLMSLHIQAQLQVKNYTNAKIDQLQTIEQVMNWTNYGQPERVDAHLASDEVIDRTYLNIESVYISKTYPRKEITKQDLITLTDDPSPIVWYERTIFKERKKGLKPAYQIYIGIDMTKSPYQIVDLFLRKGKKIVTRNFKKD
ncbi:conserved hypothetical protein [Formosa agariphila KMM 3901]|uniref:Uncharacterized protein n=1 Tax=Formosa agariphila (strain DSM 15362 / KCTC 12365 / LMG 23005 / KMM 3901 / M-2Alg 35-1) TaxID=1347342 RepID=T2KNQ6_FORAG|nr:hypothetical protein [Formosa agariphila]CDF80502.1 conserved hypothetical protein [Formosa agariphila KMM 3901]